MLDQPHGADILDAVSRLLRDTLMPRLPPDTVFQARVAVIAVRAPRDKLGAAARCRS
jgi:hypothetical protein